MVGKKEDARWRNKSIWGNDIKSVDLLFFEWIIKFITLKVFVSTYENILSHCYSHAHSTVLTLFFFPIFFFILHVIKLGDKWSRRIVILLAKTSMNVCISGSVERWSEIVVLYFNLSSSSSDSASSSTALLHFELSKILIY